MDISLHLIKADMQTLLNLYDQELKKEQEELINLRQLTLKAWAWGGYDEYE